MSLLLFFLTASESSALVQSTGLISINRTLWECTNPKGEVFYTGFANGQVYGILESTMSFALPVSKYYDYFFFSVFEFKIDNDAVRGGACTFLGVGFAAPEETPDYVTKMKIYNRNWNPD